MFKKLQIQSKTNNLSGNKIVFKGLIVHTARRMPHTSFKIPHSSQFIHEIITELQPTEKLIWIEKILNQRLPLPVFYAVVPYLLSATNWHQNKSAISSSRCRWTGVAPWFFRSSAANAHPCPFGWSRRLRHSGLRLSEFPTRVVCAAWSSDVHCCSTTGPIRLRSLSVLLVERDSS